MRWNGSIQNVQTDRQGFDEYNGVASMGNDSLWCNLLEEKVGKRSAIMGFFSISGTSSSVLQMKHDHMESRYRIEGGGGAGCKYMTFFFVVRDVFS